MPIGQGRLPRYRLSLVLLIGLLAAAACQDAVGPERGPAPPSQGLLAVLEGAIEVTAATGGSGLDEDGYTVTLDLLQTRAVDSNGSTTFSGVPTGIHLVSIAGVAANCTVSGENPRTVLVLAGQVSRTTFEVTCAATGPTTGDLAVTASTTGSEIDPDGYAAVVDGATEQPLPANGTVTFTGLAEGTHSVALTGVAANCTVGGANPRDVTVVAGTTAATTFEVTCAATGAPGARVVGTGAIGLGGATPGSDRQEFDFDVTDAPGGTLSYTDYSVVRAGGTVATILVDAAADPATGVTSFTRTSATCVAYGATGRVDDGSLMEMTIDVCDNGSPGPGVDSFGLSAPERPYFKGPDTLSEGEITLTTSP